MAVIHPLTSIAPLAEYELFAVPPTQTTVDSDTTTEHRPISTLSSNAAIKFEIHSGIDEYIRLDETELYMQIRVHLLRPMKAAITANDWKTVASVNNLLHSLFKQVDLAIGDKQVTISGHTYAYRAEIETRLGASKEAKESLLTASGWFESDKVNDSINADRSKWITPADSGSVGRKIDLMGKLHLDMTFQQKAILGGTTLRFKFTPNDLKFYMQTTTKELRIEVEFLDACLFVHKAKVSREIVEAHNEALLHSPAKYPVKRTVVKPFVISPSTLDALIDNVHNGVLPSRIFIACVTNEAFNGSYTTNPFNYQHFNINHIACHLDAIQFPSKAYTPDFTEGLYVREYFSLFESTNQSQTNSTINFSRTKYPEGNVIFGFNFAPDLSSGCGSSGHVSELKRGNLRLHIRFAKKLDQPINVLVLCEFDSVIEIGIDRNAQLDNI